MRSKWSFKNWLLSKTKFSSRAPTANWPRSSLCRCSSTNFNKSNCTHSPRRSTLTANTLRRTVAPPSSYLSSTKTCLSKIKFPPRRPKVMPKTIQSTSRMSTKHKWLFGKIIISPSSQACCNCRAAKAPKPRSNCWANFSRSFFSRATCNNYLPRIS